MSRCPEDGSDFDEGGYCAYGHEDPGMIAAERAAEERMAAARARFVRPFPQDPPPTICTYCGQPFNMINDHNRCAVASSGAKPN